MIKIICVCGARPNFMKIAPIMRALNDSGNFNTLLIHTGQHYDAKMSHLFLTNLTYLSRTLILKLAAVLMRYRPPK